MTLVENNNNNNNNLIESNDAVDQSKKTIIPIGNGHHNHNQNHRKEEEEEEGFKKDMRDLAEMLSNLNPLAEEFVPPSLSNNNNHNVNINNNFNAPPMLLPPPSAGPPFGYSAVNDFMMQPNQTPFVNINGVPMRRVYFHFRFHFVKLLVFLLSGVWKLGLRIA